MLLREPIAAFIVFAFGATVFVITGSYAPAAALFPRAAAVVMMGAAVAVGIRSFVRQIPPPADVVDPQAMPRVVGVIILTLVYIVGVDRLGYVTASVIFIPVAAWLLGIRKVALLAITTVLFVGIVSLLFRQVFNIPLPREILLQMLG